MKKILNLFLAVALMFAPVALADTSSYTTFTGDQEAWLNNVGAPSAIGSAHRVNLGTLLKEILDPVFSLSPSADSAATNQVMDLNLTTPVDTTGTNTHEALNVDLTIGNATGGTNTVKGVDISNVTGDAQVNVHGVYVGTGTILGTSTGIFVDAGWDSAAELNVGASADSANTNIGLDVDVTSPVDTTGTNSHYGINIDTTIGNASGGTNAVRGINIANVTGDAQVDVTGVNIGTGSTLGTSKAIVIGSGWDAGLEVASPVSITSTITGDGGDALVGFLNSKVASTTVALTAAQCDSTIVGAGAHTLTLPEASTVIGCSYRFVAGTADDVAINPADGTDVIGTVASITGTNTTTVLAPSAGDSITMTDVGSSITLEAVANDLWASVGNANGIWTDTN